MNSYDDDDEDDSDFGPMGQQDQDLDEYGNVKDDY